MVCVWRGGMLPLIYSWPAAHLCIQYILTGRRRFVFDTPHPPSPPPHFLTPFPFFLLLAPFPSFLSHSRQPHDCVGLSHASALVRWALLSVKPQTWDMRNGKWVNKCTQTLTCTNTLRGRVLIYRAATYFCNKIIAGRQLHHLLVTMTARCWGLVTKVLLANNPMTLSVTFS